MLQLLYVPYDWKLILFIWIQINVYLPSEQNDGAFSTDLKGEY